MVAAGVGAAVHRLEVVRRAQRVQLRQNEQLRAGSARLDVRVKAGDVPRLGERVARAFKHSLHIGVRFPFAEAGLRVVPDIFLRVHDLFAVLVNELLIKLGLHGVSSSWSINILRYPVEKERSRAGHADTRTPAPFSQFSK